MAEEVGMCPQLIFGKLEGLSLSLDWKRQRTTDVYLITSVYNVNGVAVEGEPTTTQVTYTPASLMILVR